MLTVDSMLQLLMIGKPHMASEIPLQSTLKSVLCTGNCSQISMTNNMLKINCTNVPFRLHIFQFQLHKKGITAHYFKACRDMHWANSEYGLRMDDQKNRSPQRHGLTRIVKAVAASEGHSPIGSLVVMTMTH